MRCLDTTFLIDVFRKNPDALKKALSIADDKNVATEINVFELFYGELVKKEVSQKRIDGLKEFLKGFQIFTLDRESTIKSAEIAAELTKKGQMIGEMDSLIAGIAITNGASTILTRNSKDFSKINGIKVETY